MLDGLPLTAWDLVVIDEAHAMTGHTDRHAACDALGKRARHLLLLTATPHTGDDARFDRLLTLGALDAGDDDLRVFRRTRRDAGVPLPRCVRWTRVTPDLAQSRLLTALSAFERAVLATASPAAERAALLLLAVFRKRAASTAHALHRTLERRLQWLDRPDASSTFDWLQPRLAFDEDDEHDRSEREALMGASGLTAAQERTWLRRLRALATAAMPTDPKVARLCRLLGRTRAAGRRVHRVPRLARRVSRRRLGPVMDDRRAARRPVDGTNAARRSCRSSTARPRC